jgi:hypothetical protein
MTVSRFAVGVAINVKGKPRGEGIHGANRRHLGLAGLNPGGLAMQAGDDAIGCAKATQATKAAVAPRGAPSGVLGLKNNHIRAPFGQMQGCR